MQTDQVFGGEATITNVTVTPSDVIVQAATSLRDAVTVSYDATTRTYTVAAGGRSQSFGPADSVPGRYAGETAFSKAGLSEYLTLVTNPYLDAQYTNRYVGLGYWQKNEQVGGVQQTAFSTFTYGFNTAGSSIPRTGSAHWLTDAFGLLSVPGKEVRTLYGLGDFEVDFTAGSFQASGNLDEYEVVSGGGTSGSLRLQAGGELASDGKFSGLFSYEGSPSGALHGTLNGSFYGPNAEEIGATFEASGYGAVLTGALTGQQYPLGSTSAGIKNITLTNPLATERLFGFGGGLFATTGTGFAGYQQVTSVYTEGTVTLTPAGPTEIGLVKGYALSSIDLVAGGPANFTTYRTNAGGNPAVLSLYKIGSANQELALTYSSFVSWSDAPNSVAEFGKPFTSNYMVYGMLTPRELLAGRTGSASYNGVVYGKGGATSGAVYDVRGTSRFDVDFSASSYSGSLGLKGTTLEGTLTDFGDFGFSGSLAFGQMLETPLTGATSPDGGSYIRPSFFGPSGQEIGASFLLRIGTPATTDRIEIGGIAVAKRP